ncbi:MAG: hypothetical protein HOL61_14140, partial [Rhodospirillaceae bacterium]|nr:hypothetical protein [Rhodospirillaceae bacterium]
MVNRFSRRSLGTYSLAALGATSAGHLIPAQVAAAEGQKPFKDDAELVKAVIKLKASTDGKIAFGWLRAKRWAYIDGDVTPLLGLLAGFLSKAHDNGDGTYEITFIEITYYLDVETGELLDTLTMPITGKAVKVPLYLSGPKVTTVGTQTTESEVSTGMAGVVEEEGETASAVFAPKGDVRLERSVGPAIRQGNSVWIETEEYGR